MNYFSRTSLSVILLAALSTGTAVDNDKVKVELYYESQCPGCRDTITNSFHDAFATEGFLKMADVTFVPFGNAQESGGENGESFTYECQHGPAECTYNLMEACLIDKVKCPHQRFKLINCIEKNDEDRKPDPSVFDVVLNACAFSIISDDVASAIGDCYKGDEGNALMHEMATKTLGLDPPHEYVPWLVADGVHSENIQNDIMDSLFNYVCSVYKGPNKSEKCPSTTSTLRGTTKDSSLFGKTGGNCYKEKIVQEIFE
mmetsp:Transcript_8224/g.12630  ORF Transcript_8224/g.12630 Transcript_8224/m.12630 type:complete len:258 (-) Transcript_8224:149-922(-)|eukprot:CAMPEP_0178916584 /NCGR_PEP_ID=MMETSP0786-20121207/12734_1 /TAXON_ID=186022 /ORGANISM="Thalassionema frauenfeldii, Strain CCMP 1798" /LENGTH=257 /DNA_ID=CAMNT_0020589963 /DNA_START=57 /DNA_END=830 /DNA_ORIENTATION=-